ncbi:hypothetical protein QTP88_016526 [Uroleucon formosanum]
MVDYMVQNPHVATGKFHTLNGKNSLAGSWEDLVTNLNNLRNPGVKGKNVKSWKETIFYRLTIFFVINFLQNRSSRHLSITRTIDSVSNRNLSIRLLIELQNRAAGHAHSVALRQFRMPSFISKLHSQSSNLLGTNYEVPEDHVLFALSVHIG